MLIVRPEDAPLAELREGLAGYAPLLWAGEVLDVREGGSEDVSDRQGAGRDGSPMYRALPPPFQ